MERLRELGAFLVYLNEQLVTQPWSHEADIDVEMTARAFDDQWRALMKRDPVAAMAIDQKVADAIDAIGSRVQQVAA